jgi:hypothetical protein
MHKVESRDQLLADLNQSIAAEKTVQLEAESAVRDLQLLLAEAELKKERMIYANEALQDSLAAAEAKEKCAAVSC